MGEGDGDEVVLAGRARKLVHGPLAQGRLARLGTQHAKRAFAVCLYRILKPIHSCLRLKDYLYYYFRCLSVLSFLSLSRQPARMADQVKEWAEVPRVFLHEGTQFLNRCTKRMWEQLCNSCALVAKRLTWCMNKRTSANSSRSLKQLEWALW